MIMIRYYFHIIILISSILLLSCGNKNEETKTTNKTDSSVEQYYKQFDSTMTIDKSNKLKQQVDSIYQLHDAKNKR